MLQRTHSFGGQAGCSYLWDGHASPNMLISVHAAHVHLALKENKRWRMFRPACPLRIWISLVVYSGDDVCETWAAICREGRVELTLAPANSGCTASLAMHVSGTPCWFLRWPSSAPIDLWRKGASPWRNGGRQCSGRRAIYDGLQAPCTASCTLDEPA